MTINERIKEVRNHAGLNIVEFAEKIGVTKSTTSRLEQEGYQVTPRNIQLICTTFHVSEEWLVHGTGEKYTSDADSVLQQLSSEFSLDVSTEALIRTLCELDEAGREALISFIEEAVERIKEARKKEMSNILQRPEGLTDEDWKRLQQIAESMVLEKSTTMSSVSSK